MNRATLKSEDNAVERVLYMAMELSNKRWKLVFGEGEKRRHVTVEAGCRVELSEAIGKAKERFHLPADVRMVSCYEAGRDGFWLHRYLLGMGIENQVGDSSSIETNRRARRAKTDRLDGDKLLNMLIRYCAGEKGVWSVVRVPSVEDEDARRLHREMERLKKERTAHRNRVRSLLVAQGLQVEPNGEFLKRLERLKHAMSPALQQVVQLMELRAIGPVSAWVLVLEFFSWRGLRNRREVAALAGLTGTPYASGESWRDQGISKAGNPRVRTRMIEIAWLWLRYQPDSALSQWFKARFASGGPRMRRVGIVALARRLLIALWRCLGEGLPPQGAGLKGAL